MALILSIETSTPICSIALHKGTELLAKLSIHREQSHSTILNSSIESILNFCELEIADLSAVAISKGPGSYTGLRIGTSTAKGLCYALDIPLIGINALEAMAIGVSRLNTSGHWLCPMLDARRMEVYTALFNSNLKTIENTQALILDEQSYINKLDENAILFFGSGSDKFQKIMNHSNAHFVENIYPEAQYIGELAITRYEEKKFEDVAYFEPFYLKEFRVTKPKAKV